MRRIATWCLALVAGMAAPAAAWAQAQPLDIQQNYSGTTAVPVYDIELYNTYANGPGTSNSYSINAGVFSLNDPFLKSSANPPLLTYFLGVASYANAVTSSVINLGDSTLSPAVVALPQHLVLAVSSAYAAGLVSGGQDFSAIFPAFDENSLINDLHTIGSNSSSSTDAQRNAAQSELFSFDTTIQSRGGLTPALGGPLTLLSFSGGTVVGQGTAALIPLGGGTPIAGAAPEVGTWAMMIVGLGAAGIALRRRRATSTSPVSLA